MDLSPAPLLKERGFALPAYLICSRHSPPWGRDGEGSCREWFIQVYNSENRISSIQKLADGTCDDFEDLAMQWDFVYDGDGVRTVTATTAYIARSARVFPLRGRCAQHPVRADPAEH
jgi:hypothetical protein